MKPNCMKKITYLILFCTVCSLMAYGQQKTISGKVVPADGSPVASVTLQVDGTSATTQTDGECPFSLAGNVGATESVTSLGYPPSTFGIDSRDFYEVRLSDELTDLDEVVVTALGIKRERRQLTYSTQQVSGESIANSKEPSVLNALSGKISGVQITSSTGQPGSSSRIVIRGTSSLLG